MCLKINVNGEYQQYAVWQMCSNTCINKLNKLDEKIMSCPLTALNNIRMVQTIASLSNALVAMVVLQNVATETNKIHNTKIHM